MKFFGIFLCAILTIGVIPLQDYLPQNTAMLPKAYAASNPNLFVSAENSQWNNYFAGPQVIQVIVSDSDINRLDQHYGEPVVTVNGKRLRMAQATDGNWYGYFADRNQAEIASNTAPVSGHGLNFGGLCGMGTIGGVDFGLETKGFTTAYKGVTGAVGLSETGSKVSIGPLGNTCSGTGTSLASPQEHVVRESKTLNTNPLGYNAAAALVDVWPVIQLYDFSVIIPTSVIVDYQKAGGDQVVNLTFDKIPSNLISLTPDRNSYPENSQVFLTMNDPQLNVDPTEEDSWTWGASGSNNTLFYQAFDRNGHPDADGTAAMQNLAGNLTTFMFGHNGKLTLDPSASGVRVVDLQSNGRQLLNGSPSTRGDPARQATASIAAGSEPLTFSEQGTSAGIFVNWDGGKKSDIVTTDLNIRGMAATVKYNNISSSIVGAFSFGSVTMTSGGVWMPSQSIPVTLTDMDENKNSKIAEHLNLFDSNVDRVPTMRVGTPFTLTNTNATFFSSSSIATNKGVSFMNTMTTDHTLVSDRSQDELFSGRPVYSVGIPVTIHDTGGLVLDLGTSMQTLRNTIHDAAVGNPEEFKGFNFLNLDLTSLNTAGAITKVNVYLAHNAGPILANNDLAAGVTLVSIANTTSLRDFINLNVTAGKIANPAEVNKNLFAIPTTDHIGLVFKFSMSSDTTLDANVGHPIVTDFFSVGFFGDGITKSQKINNAIYRWELSETGISTGVFTGSSQYAMLNQLNIFDPATYAGLRTISSDVRFVAIDDMLQSENRAPNIAYLDLGADGIDAPVSAQQDVPTHTGLVSFDKTQYGVGNTATVTLNDADLSTSGLVSIYTSVPSGSDPAAETVGKGGLGLYRDGSPMGRLLEIKINGVRWSSSGCYTTPTDASGYPTGLGASGFSLVETVAGSGIFQGTFTVPDEYCVASKITSSTSDAKLEVVYVDFSDANGQGSVEEADTTIHDNNISIPQQFQIHLRNADFTPIPGTNIAAIQGNHSLNDRVHFLLQFRNMPTLSDRNIITNNNISLTDYVTGNTFIASARVSDLNNLNSLLNSNFIRWSGPLSQDLKIAPVLKTNDLNAIPSWAVYNSQVVITAVLDKDANITDVVKKINQLGGTVEATVPLIPSVTAFFDLDKVSAVAGIDDVQFVDVVDPPLVPQDDYTRNASSVTPLESTPYSLSGKGITVLLIDGAPPYPHPDFISRLQVLQPSYYQQVLENEVHGITTGGSSYQLHATGMAGILGGDGSLPNKAASKCPGECPAGYDHRWRGMAPEIEILAYGLILPNGSQPAFTDNTVFANIASYTGSGTATGTDSQADLGSMSVAIPAVSNGSTPSAKAWLGKYSPSAQAVDSLVKDSSAGQGFVIFEAVGNQRQKSTFMRDFWTIDPPATAKNSIAVGAIGATDFATVDLSSYGPTGINDTHVTYGRIKPDLTAPGCSTSDSYVGFVISTGWDNARGADYENTYCGTSEATPAAAGAGALVAQEWKEKMITPAGTPLYTLYPRTMKAILVHTATDLGNPGPDYKFGWGAINAKAAVDLVNDSANNGGPEIFEGDSIPQNGSSKSYTFHSDGNHKVKATLVWDDIPGNSQSGQDLINDLGLKLIGPDEKTYWPFVLDPANPDVAAKTGNDSNNNVEMAIGNATSIAGSWNVVVYGSKIATTTPQQFSLIVSELRQTVTSVLPSIANVAVGSSIQLSATVSDIDATSTPRTLAGWIYFDDKHGGSFDNETCNNSGTSLTCTADYSPKQPQSFPQTYQVHANYLGDGDHSTSSGVASVSITPNPLSATKTYITLYFNTNQGPPYLLSWVKNDAGWWANGKIDDSTFVTAIQYLIAQGFMKIPTAKIIAGSDQVIQSWLRSDAGWWANGNMTDHDFIVTMQWMIENGITKIPINISASGPGVTFAATVNDTASSPTTPTGSVYWSDGSVGGNFSTLSCTLLSGNCTVSYTPLSSSPSSTVNITASYGGDSTHSASLRTLTVGVTP